MYTSKARKIEFLERMRLKQMWKNYFNKLHNENPVRGETR